MNQIHPYKLEHKWVLYHLVKCDSATYDKNINRICSFDNLIDFWRVFNNYPLPSMLFHNPTSNKTLCKNNITAISVFKDGIMPKWEDDVNKHGAEFLKRISDESNPLKEIDNNWLELLYLCVGSSVSKYITGIRVVDSSNVKNNKFKYLYRVELWFSDISQKKNIEKVMKEVLGDCLLVYKTHMV